MLLIIIIINAKVLSKLHFNKADKKEIDNSTLSKYNKTLIWNSKFSSIW